MFAEGIFSQLHFREEARILKRKGGKFEVIGIRRENC